MTLEITNVAYGIIGTGGTYIGIVYNDKISDSSSETSFNLDESEEYTAAVLYTYTNAHAKIKTKTGNFDIWAF